MTGKLTFIGRFLAIFAGLIILGWGTDAPRFYAGALESTAALVSPVVNGWWLEARPGATGATQLWFHRGEVELRLLLSLDALALGLLPLLSLLGATPGLGLKHLSAVALVGVAALFALDLVILLLYPALVSQPNALTDIVGTFLGLLTFVGGPVILWFVLTFDRLRALWRLK